MLLSLDYEQAEPAFQGRTAFGQALAVSADSGGATGRPIGRDALHALQHLIHDVYFGKSTQATCMTHSSSWQQARMKFERGGLSAKVAKKVVQPVQHHTNAH